MIGQPIDDEEEEEEEENDDDSRFVLHRVPSVLSLVNGRFISINQSVMFSTTLMTPLSTTTMTTHARVASGVSRNDVGCLVLMSRERAGARRGMKVVAKMANPVISELSRGKALKSASALAPPERYVNTIATVGASSVQSREGMQNANAMVLAGGEFMTPSFAFYALCGVGCLLGSALSAVLLSLVPTLRSVRRTMDEIAYLAASVREEIPDTLAAVRVSGLELTDCIEEVGELTADLGGGIRSAGRGITASVNTAQALGRYAAQAIPEVRSRAQPIVNGVKNESVKILQERADMEPYSGPIIASTANTAKKGVVAARNALKSADVARNVGRLYKTIRSTPARPKKD